MEKTPLKDDIDRKDAAHAEILSITIHDKAELYKVYMPFVKDGGIFVATTKNFHLNEAVFLVVNLFNEPDKFTVEGKVIWITPKAAQGGKAAGIGIQFVSEDAKELRNKIESHLAGANASDRRTDTM